MSCSQHKT